jgi:hypothetical protein
LLHKDLNRGGPKEDGHIFEVPYGGRGAAHIQL